MRRVGRTEGFDIRRPGRTCRQPVRPRCPIPSSANSDVAPTRGRGNRRIRPVRVDDALLPDRIAALVEATGELTVIADLAGRVLYLNPAGRALVGLGRDADVTATSILDYLPQVALTMLGETAYPRVPWRGESALRDHRGGPPIVTRMTSFLLLRPGTHEPFGIAAVEQDCTARLVTAERQLLLMAGQRHALLRNLVDAQELERARIAADIHDDTVQSLAAVDLRLGVLRRSIGDSVPEWVALIEQVQRTVSHTTDGLRDLLFELEPPAVDVSLVDDLHNAAAYILESSPIAWTVTGDVECDLPYAERVKAVRIAKEALGNARKHARATTVTIALRCADDGVEIAVTDDGIGIDPRTTEPQPVRSAPGHLGLTTMRYRAEIAGGWCRLERAPGHGTVVRFWLPCAPLKTGAPPVV